jgi:hypothetical protein
VVTQDVAVFGPVRWCVRLGRVEGGARATLVAPDASAVDEIVLPVRLPSAPSNQAHVEHHLADPSRWHKIDLVRTQDPTVIGGWRYEAHLMVLTNPYVSPATEQARALTPSHRTAGGDLNVSNLTVASHDAGGDLQITRIERDHQARQAERARAKKARDRQRALDR